jgi:nicotinate-nucleotide pyrophosphorylase (carboxylating)
MTGFTPAETAACCRLVELALKEDFGNYLGWRRDPTSYRLTPAGYLGKGHFVARSAGVIAGLPALALVLGSEDMQFQLETDLVDGIQVEAGARLAAITGPINVMLSIERTALNFVQRLSGVASLTRRFVDAVAGLPCRILDTRKTTPGWRLLEKYAVRCGGGHNHRMGLYDQFLIKDNHLAAGRLANWTITSAIKAAQRDYPHGTPLLVEVEVNTLEQFDEALAAGPDVILLDNMTLEQMREAVRRRNATQSKVLLEASGGVNLQTVRAIAETGVDRISVGALTHSAPALDIALDYQAP